MEATVLNSTIYSTIDYGGNSDSTAMALFFTPIVILRFVGNLLAAFFLMATNARTILAVLTTDSLRTKTNAILASLAVSDICSVISMAGYTVFAPLIGYEFDCSKGVLLRASNYLWHVYPFSPLAAN